MSIDPHTEPSAPHVTILNYYPSEGAAPLRVTAIRGLSGGQAEQIVWRTRRKGGATWIVVATNPASKEEHTFLFKRPGVYEIGCDVLGPGGVDGTSRPRVVKVA